jgi:hypothetical protein
MKTLITAGFIAVFLLTGAVTKNVQAADDFNTWQNTLAPLYLWGQSLDGTINDKVGLQIDFNEAVKDLNGVATVHYEGAKGHWGIIADYSFVNIRPEGTGPGGVPVAVDMENTIAEIGALYRFGPNNPWQLLGGVRRYDLDVDIVVGPVTPVTIKKSFTDFFIGGRIINQFGKKWSFIARADVGTGDSDLVWNALVSFDYRFNNVVSGLVGYRVIDYDVDEPDFKYQMNHSGPVLALAFHW